MTPDLHQELSVIEDLRTQRAALRKVNGTTIDHRGAKEPRERGTDLAALQGKWVKGSVAWNEKHMERLRVEKCKKQTGSGS